MYGWDPRVPWPYGPQGPPQQNYIPVPHGTDIEGAIKILERIDRKRKKKEEEAKKKEDEKKKPKPNEGLPKVNILTVFLLMMSLGLPIGYLQLVIAQSVATSIKALLP